MNGKPPIGHRKVTVRRTSVTSAGAGVRAFSNMNATPMVRR
jgi:hypothetical protein